MNKEIMICPKNNKIVNCCSCICLKNLSKIMAEFFAQTICSSVNGCPKEDYCVVFEKGWNSVGSLFQTTLLEQ